MVIRESMDLMEKLSILSDAAKYDVACTSSGVNRNGDGKGIGNSVAAGICHSFSGDGRCISLLKILYTNECVFDCKYCVNQPPTMWCAPASARRRCAVSPWSFTGGII